MPTIRDRLLQLITSLDENENFDVTSAEVGEPATKAEIEAARKSVNGYLPPGVEEFYSSVGSFTLEWNYVGRLPRLNPRQSRNHPALRAFLRDAFQKEARMGSINILPITKVFSSWADSIWFPTPTDRERGYDGSGPDDGDGENWMYNYRHVKPFDHFSPEACVAFVLRRESGKDCWKPLDRVAYHYCGEELAQTDWMFEEYLERVLISRGFWAWCDPVVFRDREALEIMASLLFKERPESDPDYKD